MYNLTVDEAHTFFVGEEGWLVHNQDEPPIQLPIWPSPFNFGETRVGTYNQNRGFNVKSEISDLNPHHMPSNAHMDYYASQLGYTRGTGITFNMNYDRHSLTWTFRNPIDYSLSPREFLAKDISDVINIYKSQDLYNSEMRQVLLSVINQNKKAFPELFAKTRGC